jgi:signal transduction histidine kinase
MAVSVANTHPTTATILIVDDTPANLALVVEYMETQGFRMLVAQGGEEGLQRAALVQPDLILLDAIMPGLNGFDVCRRLKARESTRDIPVIFMTSLTGTDDKLRAFAVGAVDYVVKPLQVQEVMARANAHLSLRAVNKQLAAQNERLQQEIVERTRAENKVIERTAQLVAANQELEAFSYSVSHDLRAPLRAIRGFAEILRANWSASAGEDGRRCLEKIIAAGERMERLIEDLLLYARTGHAVERAVAVPLSPLLGQLTAEFGERIAAAGAQIEISKPLATPLGDPTLIGQILNNLVDNALTYRCLHGTPEIRISAKHVGRDVMIQVADNGIGIEPEYHQKIFQVFQRLHGNDEYPGTGLGLAIVAKAARLMKGDVGVESVPGQGSTFSVRMPAAGGDSAWPAAS